MRVWRLAVSRYPEIDGEGARLYGGRWNSPGVPMVYAATHITLALLEQLVHVVSPERLPASLRAFAIGLPDDAPVETADPAINADEPKGCREYGDIWAASLRSAALIVPSVLVPPRLDPGAIGTEERNVLLNPRHGSAVTWRVLETSFRIDSRLKRASAR